MNSALSQVFSWLIIPLFGAQNPTILDPEKQLSCAEECSRCSNSLETKDRRILSVFGPELSPLFLPARVRFPGNSLF